VREIGSDPIDEAPLGTRGLRRRLLRHWFVALTWPRDDGTWPASTLGDDLLAEALESAWGRACSGAETPPAWGEVHRTASRHPLHPVSGTEPDPPPAGIGGDNETIQNGAYGWGEDAAFDITNLSVYRQVLDFDDLDAWARHRLVPMRPAWEADR
jgi:penicillin amidase